MSQFNKTSWIAEQHVALKRNGVKERGWLGFKPTKPNIHYFSLCEVWTTAIESSMGQRVAIFLSRNKYHWWDTYTRRYMLFSRMAPPWNSPFMSLLANYNFDMGLHEALEHIILLARPDSNLSKNIIIYCMVNIIKEIKVQCSL